jgi:hypothetical protein
MRKRTVKLWRLHEDGRKLFARWLTARQLSAAERDEIIPQEATLLRLRTRRFRGETPNLSHGTAILAYCRASAAVT